MIADTVFIQTAHVWKIEYFAIYLLSSGQYVF